MSEGLVLVGLPGSGKSTVGREVAARLGKAFVDIDEAIQQAVGRPAADVLRTEGEPRLREVEREAVAAAVERTGAVIATGGGTVVDPLNRWLLMDHGIRVRLEAPTEQLAERLRADATTPRPLLDADLVSGLARTADARASVYAAVDAVVDASRDVASSAAAVAEASGSWHADAWRPLLDATFERHHPIGSPRGRLLMGRGLTESTLAEALGRAAGGEPVVIADRQALAANPRLAAALAGDRMCVTESGEEAKTMRSLDEVLNWLAVMNVERLDPLVAVGGGTLGDLAGLAAALHRRGMPLVNIPTTWLAQADSAIGGKVAVDLPNAKNGVGAFWPPVLVVEDAALVDSLPIDRRRDGIAECLKAGLIGDPILWRLVEERGSAALDGNDPAAAYAITERAVRVKLELVGRDPFESNERRKLNLGHTIGHALEVESGYTLAHGTAVALGLRAVVRIATGRGADRSLPERVDSLLATLGFPTRRRFERASLVSALGGDKKRERGVQRWILPLEVGHVVEVGDVSDAELSLALDAIAE